MKIVWSSIGRVVGKHSALVSNRISILSLPFISSLPHQNQCFHAGFTASASGSNFHCTVIVPCICICYSPLFCFHFPFSFVKFLAFFCALGSFFRCLVWTMSASCKNPLYSCLEYPLLHEETFCPRSCRAVIVRCLEAAPFTFSLVPGSIPDIEVTRFINFQSKH